MEDQPSGLGDRCHYPLQIWFGTESPILMSQIGFPLKHMLKKLERGIGDRRTLASDHYEFESLTLLHDKK